LSWGRAWPDGKREKKSPKDDKEENSGKKRKEEKSQKRWKREKNAPSAGDVEEGPDKHTVM